MEKQYNIDENFCWYYGQIDFLLNFLRDNDKSISYRLFKFHLKRGNFCVEKKLFGKLTDKDKFAILKGIARLCLLTPQELHSYMEYAKDKKPYEVHWE